MEGIAAHLAELSERTPTKKRKRRHGYDSDDSFVVGDSAFDDDLIVSGKGNLFDLL